jgi:hypothetical protein
MACPCAVRQGRRKRCAAEPKRSWACPADQGRVADGRAAFLELLAAGVLDILPVFLICADRIARTTSGIAVRGFQLEDRPAVLLFALDIRCLQGLRRIGGTVLRWPMGVAP